MPKQNDLLTNELVSLFDLKKSKLKNDKDLTQAAYDAHKDIRYITLMFSDGIPTVVMPVNERETLKWDEKAQKLLYICDETTQLLEAASKEVRVKMRPYLTELVKKAREFYSND